MSRVSHVEGQRAIFILQQILDKTQLITLITREVTAAPAEELADIANEEFISALKVQKNLEEQYADAMHAKKTNAQYDKVQMKKIAGELRVSTLTLCKLLEKNPTLVERLRQYQVGGRSQPLKLYLKGMGELQDIFCRRLSTSVEEEQSKLDFLADIQQKEQKSTAELKALQMQLVELRGKHDKEINSRNILISRLKEDVQEIQASAAAESREVEAESSFLKSKDVQAAVEKLTTALDEQIKNDKKAEQNTRKKKLKVRGNSCCTANLFEAEKEVENWIHKYDLEMTEKETDIDNLTKEYQSIYQETLELEAIFQKLVVERDELLASEQKIQEEQMKEMEQIRHLHHSAAVIQRWWREKHKKLLHDRKLRKKKPGTAKERSPSPKKKSSTKSGKTSSRSPSPSKRQLLRSTQSFWMCGLGFGSMATLSDRSPPLRTAGMVSIRGPTHTVVRNTLLSFKCTRRPALGVFIWKLCPEQLIRSWNLRSYAVNRFSAIENIPR
ncbi:hypothetical protein PROFUN_04000 [Planoprotostelium fungivorum]|uniref:Dynein regulatory complex protein 10 n=1 Tax=Planoprotostelium fungivorum TaxID=1890364 RepID=A0A2P6NW33_9EUKA|nr:hypothetical protein PROFUN_04000 [Planoprotostelium fungivorum]